MPQPETAPASLFADRAEESTGDAFAAAAEALQFTGEMPPAAATAAEREPVRRREARSKRLTTPFRRFAAATASAAAVVTAGLIALGTTMPFATSTLAAAEVSVVETDRVAEAAQSLETSDAAEGELQAFVSGSGAHNEELVAVQGYEASTFQALAEADGISTSGAFFDNDPRADIQWPFAVGTSMSSGFGPRWGRMHEGVDFTPGDGAPIQAVADGVVRVATEAGGAYGVNVYLDHVIDGQVVTTHYAHMQYGSLRVTNGQTVEVGDVLGLTGNTGRSYGAHLHFEVIIGGTAIDPLPWLEEHANTRYSDEERAAVAEQAQQMLGADLSDEG
ncbi:M23 family metallopeptidase [Microbacterium sp. gxy059]|uniref:M23 family metallopeptidase n=1 Tax=Microbacterium sp. gxy059 TaxID=2957199 RepID=UPI003D96147A